ncbi:sugar-binding transcriptional regulator [Aquibacillus rhizosphaerae]|uniref:Sugar-binding domain-containing protein n=1 Tax=Aquibacillus rhizosphaerae TaxID=3051431 RepID=A0ABT7L3X6_9BACI|nr:sugar-binding domain-containing protein [Aquibacillus sp. LR5S19]MDL4839301.1 sugar-binding domain-containing protein [Aquibacillus sp. LR5S19]
MRALIDLQKKLFPDLLDVMQRRYKILHYIHLMEPIGRRSLADNIDMTERIVRSEIDFLNKNGFIDVTAKGMHLTRSGNDVLDQLANFMKEVSGFSVLEQHIKDKLQLDHVIVIPGNSDEHDWVKQELGKACVQFLKSMLNSDQTIAVTGGTSMAAVAEVMKPLKGINNCMFVPARGGLGERVENQANTICAEMAKKANGQYRLLYVPDQLSEESYQSIIGEPSVKEVLDLIHEAAVVIHGIGDAITMAKRRKASEQVLKKIKAGNAVSEAFGYYFNDYGEVVHKVRTVGIQLEDLSDTNCVIAVAGGESKAKAIISYFRQGKSNVLITDEAAANELIRGFSL